MRKNRRIVALLLAVVLTLTFNISAFALGDSQDDQQTIETTESGMPEDNDSTDDDATENPDTPEAEIQDEDEAAPEDETSSDENPGFEEEIPASQDSGSDENPPIPIQPAFTTMGADILQATGRLVPSAIDPSMYSENHDVSSFSEIESIIDSQDLTNKSILFTISSSSIAFTHTLEFNGYDFSLAFRSADGTPVEFTPPASGDHFSAMVGYDVNLSFESIVLEIAGNTGGIGIHYMEDASLIIDGNGNTVFNGDSALRSDSMLHFTADGGGYTGTNTITVKNLTMQNGLTGGTGVGIRLVDNSSISVSEITVENSVFHNLVGNAQVGGALYFGVDSVIVDGCLFTQNKGAAGGGALALVSPSQTATVKNSEFTQNEATPSNNGGAIYANTAMAIRVENSVFDRNNATGLGGAVGTPSSSTLTIVDSSFTGNTAQTGGAIHTAGALVIENTAGGKTEFNGNNASGSAGAVYNVASATIGSRTSFTGNYAPTAGALYLAAGGSITGAVFEDNEARATTAGAVYAAGTVTMDGVRVHSNKAETNGAGLYVSGASTVKNSTFTSNTALKDGGAIFVNATNSVTLQGTTIGGDGQEGNQAENGGGIASSHISAMGTSGPRITMDSATTVTGNSASGMGGGIYHTGRYVTISGGNVERNNAPKGGGIGINLLYSGISATIDSVAILENAATGNGGGIYLLGSSPLTVTNSSGNGSIKENTSVGDGGGIYSEGAAVAVKDTVMADNQTQGLGGAIGIPTIADRNSGITTDNVTFTGNTANHYVTFISSADLATHSTNITNSPSYSVNDYGIQFTHAYNNYDIMGQQESGIWNIYYHLNYTVASGEDQYANIDTVVDDEDALLSNVPTPQREGYNFLGWAYDEDASGPDFTVPGDVDDTVFTNVTEDKTLYAVWQPMPNIVVEKTAVNRYSNGENAVFSGEYIDYTITLTNVQRPGSVPNAPWDGSLQDLLPEQYTLPSQVSNISLSSASAHVNVMQQNNRVVIDVTDIALDNGESFTITYTLQAPVIESASTEYLTLVNTATATGRANSNSDGINGTATHTMYVVPKAGSIQVIKAVSDTSGNPVNVVKVGDTLRYSIVVENTGDADTILLNPIISDALPTGLDFVPGTARLADLDGQQKAIPNSECLLPNGDISYTYNGSLRGGQSITITFDAKVNKHASGEISNTARASAEVPVEPVEPDTTPDPAGHDSRTDTDTDTTPDAAPNITKFSKDGNAQVVLYGDIHYTITMANEAGAGVWRGNIEDVMPDSLTLVPNSLNIEITGPEAATSSSYDIAGSGFTGNALLIKDLRLYGGETITITFSATVTGSVDKITNVATATNEDPTIPTEDTDIVTTVVHYTTGELEVTKNIYDTMGNPLQGITLLMGEAVKYSMTVTNSSADELSGLLNLVIKDTAPPDISFVVSSLVVYLEGQPTSEFTLVNNTSSGFELKMNNPLAGGKTVTVEINATVTGSTYKQITNTVTATAQTPEGPVFDPDDSAYSEITLTDSASVTNPNGNWVQPAIVNITATPSVFSGGDIDYTATVTPLTAGGWNGSLILTLPTGVTVPDNAVVTLSGSTGSATYSWANGVLTVSGISLAALADSITVSFTATAPTLPDITTVNVTAEAEIINDLMPEEGAEDTDEATTSVIARPGEISIEKYVTSTNVDYNTFIADPDAYALTGPVEKQTTVRYWLLVRSDGTPDSLVLNIVVQDPLHASLTITEYTQYPDNITHVLNNGVNYIHTTSFAGGEYFVLSYDALVDVTTVGRGESITNNATVTADIITNAVTGESLTLNDRDSATIDLLPDPEVTLEKTATAEVVQGGAIEYKVTLTNATGVATWKGSLQDNLNNALLNGLVAGTLLDYVPGSANLTLAGGAKADAPTEANGLVAVDNITLPAGASLTLTFTAKVVGTVAVGDTITNIATVGDSTNVDTGKDRADTDIVQYGDGTLTASKGITTLDGGTNLADTAVSVGAEVLYTITAQNTGAADTALLNLHITDAAPADVDFDMATLTVTDGSGNPLAYTNSSTANHIDITLTAPLIGGQKAVVSVEAVVARRTGPTITNIAGIEYETPSGGDGKEEPPVTVDNEDYVAPIPSISITAEKAIFSRNSINYSVVAKNGTETEATWRGDVVVSLAPGLEAKANNTVLLGGSATAGGTPAWNAAGTELTVSGVVLAPGEELTLSFTTDAVTLADHNPALYNTKAEMGAPLPDALTAQATDTAGTWVIPLPGKLNVEKAVADEDGAAITDAIRNGAVLQYTITAQNTETAPDTVLQQLVLTDVLDGYLVFDQSSLTVNGAAPAEGSVVFNEGTNTLTYSHPTALGGSQQVVLVFNVQVSIPLEDLPNVTKIDNVANGTATVPKDPVPPTDPTQPTEEETGSNDPKDPSVDVTYQPNVSIAKQANTNRTVIGGNVEYVITATNAPDADGWMGSLLDELDDRLDFVPGSLTITGAGSYQTAGYVEADHAIGVEGITLLPGESLELRFTVKVNTQAEIGEAIPNVVVAPPGYRPDPDDEEDRTSTVTVEQYGDGDLTATKGITTPDGLTDLADTAVSVGTEVLYTITAQNTGAADTALLNLHITDTAPADVDFDMATLTVTDGSGNPLAYTNSSTANHIDITLTAPLTGGQKAVVSVEAVVARRTGPTITNIAGIEYETPSGGDGKEDPKVSVDNEDYVAPIPSISITAEKAIFSRNSINYSVVAKNGTETEATWRGDVVVTLAPGLEVKANNTVLLGGSATAGGTPAWNAAGTELTVSGVVLAPGEELTLSFTTDAVTLADHNPALYNTKAEMGAPLPDALTAQATDTAGTWVMPLPGKLSVEKAVADEDGDAITDAIRNGAVLQYTITAQNTETAPDTVLQQLVLTDVLDSYLVFDQSSLTVNGAAPAEGSVVFDEDTNTLTYSHPTALGGSQQVVLVFNVQVSIPLEDLPNVTKIDNVANGTATVPKDPVPPTDPTQPTEEETGSNDPEDPSVDVTYQPDVTITKQAGNSRAVIGGNVEYVITATNAIDADGWMGSLLDELDDRLDFVPGSLTITGTGSYQTAGYVEAGHAIGVEGITLLPGESLELRFTCTVNNSAQVDDEIENVVIAQPKYRPDPDDEEDRTTIVTVVEYSPGTLEVEKLVFSPDGLENLGEATLRLGDKVQYRIHVGNTATETALLADVEISDPLPKGMEYVDGTLQVVDEFGNPVAFTETTVEADEVSLMLDEPLYGGQEVIVTFTVTLVRMAEEKQVQNVATVTGATPDEENPGAMRRLMQTGTQANPMVDPSDPGPGPGPGPNPDPGPGTDPGTDPTPTPGPGTDTETGGDTDGAVVATGDKGMSQMVALALIAMVTLAGTVTATVRFNKKKGHHRW